jgi:GT2 family glycosyltransferase
MAGIRSSLIDIGGFDERLFVAEDVDLAYRWVRANGRISYRPEIVVWHTDWRTRDQLAKLNVEYSHGAGMFYAKYLRQGEYRVLSWLIGDILRAARDLGRRIAAPDPERWWDESRAFRHGFLAGLRVGWRTFGAAEWQSFALKSADSELRDSL